MVIADFALKFGLVLKTFNLSRGRMAQAIGVDKSVVSRWASGAQDPSDHNLTLLTEVVSRHCPGFSQKDWELQAQAFEDRLSAMEARQAMDRPSIAVLPFQNMSGDPEHEYFSDGMVEDIVTALSRIPPFFVIARTSTLTYKGRAVDVRQVGRELGVRYILEGSVRRAGDRLRITGQLIDSTQGAHIWADRYDGLIDDVFDLQDKLTASIVAAIEPKVQEAEIRRAQFKPTRDLTAHDCYLRAIAAIDRQTSESTVEALTLLRRATEADPEHSSAHALASMCYDIRKVQSWGEPSENAALGLAAARRAIATGGNDPIALATAGLALSVLAQQHAEALSQIERALELNANCVQAWSAGGWVNCFLGNVEESIKAFEKAMRLNPLDPSAYRTYCGIGLGHFATGDLGLAEQYADRSLRYWSSYAPALRLKLLAAGAAGRSREANEAIARLAEVMPRVTVSSVMSMFIGPMSAARQALFESALRKAGLPE